MKEIWKPVPGYEDSYLVSNWGRVMSLERVVSHPRIRQGLRLKQKVLQPLMLQGMAHYHLNRNGIHDTRPVIDLQREVFEEYEIHNPSSQTLWRFGWPLDTTKDEGAQEVVDLDS